MAYSGLQGRWTRRSQEGGGGGLQEYEAGVMIHERVGVQRYTARVMVVGTAGIRRGTVKLRIL